MSQPQSKGTSSGVLVSLGLIIGLVVGFAGGVIAGPLLDKAETIPVDPNGPRGPKSHVEPVPEGSASPAKASGPTATPSHEVGEEAPKAPASAPAQSAPSPAGGVTPDKPAQTPAATPPAPASPAPGAAAPK